MGASVSSSSEIVNWNDVFEKNELGLFSFEGNNCEVEKKENNDKYETVSHGKIYILKLSLQGHLICIPKLE